MLPTYLRLRIFTATFIILSAVAFVNSIDSLTCYINFYMNKIEQKEQNKNDIKRFLFTPRETPASANAIYIFDQKNKTHILPIVKDSLKLQSNSFEEFKKLPEHAQENAILPVLYQYNSSASEPLKDTLIRNILTYRLPELIQILFFGLFLIRLSAILPNYLFKIIFMT